MTHPQGGVGDAAPYMLNFRNVVFLPHTSARTHSETAARGVEDFMR